MNREELLNEAMKIVTGHRQATYGEPEDNFQVIARYWSNYLETPISAADVANMMILLKLGRLTTGNPTIDSYIDIAGYAACGAELHSNAIKNQLDMQEDN